jgi:hypothetical protein
LKALIAGVLLAFLLLAFGGAAALAAEPAPSRISIDRCAAAYGALAQQQGAFGTADSLMGERYFNYAKISYDDRLTQLARKAEKGVTELRNATEAERTELYMKLVDAETEGELDVKPVHDLVLLSDSCDLEFGFGPSLGG